MSTYRTYTPVLSRTCSACNQGTGRWQCSVCLVVVCTGCWHLCPSESDDEAETPGHTGQSPVVS